MHISSRMPSNPAAGDTDSQLRTSPRSDSCIARGADPVHSLRRDRLAVLMGPDWRLTGSPSDGLGDGDQLRLMRPAAGDLIVAASTVRLARAKLANLIDAETEPLLLACDDDQNRAAERTSEIVGSARLDTYAVSDRAWIGIQKGRAARGLRASGKSDRPRKSKSRAPAPKPRFTPMVQGAIDRVVERIAAEDSAAKSRPIQPTSAKSARKPGLNLTESHPQIPGAPKGYPSSSRLTHLRIQVKGSPGTGRRR